ncbi:MAG: hypothetical protein JW787_17690 [Sedimentisphaerales bacterium]|nr:hypothetical protein [Sedimentisphaerales bacterium]
MSLKQREKQIIIGGIAGLGLLLAFQVFVKPEINRTKTLKRVVSEKREILNNLQIKSKEYISLKNQLEQIHARIRNQQKDKKILSSIEQIQKDCGLTRNVVNISPTTSAISNIYEKTNVEVKYAAVTLEQIIQFLLKIESSDLLIGISSLEIKRGLQNPLLLDAAIQLVNVSSVKPD